MQRKRIIKLISGRRLKDVAPNDAKDIWKDRTQIWANMGVIALVGLVCTVSLGAVNYHISRTGLVFMARTQLSLSGNGGDKGRFILSIKDRFTDAEMKQITAGGLCRYPVVPTYMVVIASDKDKDMIEAKNAAANKYFSDNNVALNARVLPPAANHYWGSYIGISASKDEALGLRKKAVDAGFVETYITRDPESPI